MVFDNGYRWISVSTLNFSSRLPPPDGGYFITMRRQMNLEPTSPLETAQCFWRYICIGTEEQTHSRADIVAEPTIT